ncbi:Bug family tripartite tricarboxylate transporter substrate binding protein [Halomonas sp. HK25]|uniref:Bug family tripartite tricarboxylate transporter substrate binding protein n=1 Tax=Halomonas sp. HK25 TaxID=3394321 RepID=UPI0039FD285F
MLKPDMLKPGKLKRAGAIVTMAMLPMAGQALAEYPERSIHGTIPWGAGGATDNVARALAPHIEEQLGTDLVLTNRPGGTGVIGMHHVMRKRPDGYNILFAADNAQLYQVLGLADFDYDAMQTINIIGQNLAVIATSPDSEFDDFAELMAYAEQHPGELRMGGTGSGGLPSTVHAMINAVDELEVRMVTFGGDGPGITALLGGHIDFMPLSLAAAKEYINSGKLKGLAVVDTAESQAVPGVPPITEAIPTIETYLPWGSFWGVWVPESTPDDIQATLSEAVSAAVASEGFQEFLVDYGAMSLNLTGDEAQAYLDKWQSVTTWAMQAAGATQQSPEAFGIPKP